MLSSWKTVEKTIIMFWSYSVSFKGKSSSALNLIFIYFSLESSEWLVFYLIRSLILIYSFPYIFNVSLLSSVGTGIKYLFQLLSSL